MSDPGGPEVRINTTEEGDQLAPACSEGRNFNFLVAWESQGPVDSEIRAQFFDAGGSDNPDPFGPEFAVSTTTDGNQWAPRVLGNGWNGRFIVAYNSDHLGDTTVVLGQRLTEQVARDGDDFELHPGEALLSADAQMVHPGWETIQVFWAAENGPDTDIIAQELDSETAEPVGDRIQIRSQLSTAPSHLAVSNAYHSGPVVCWVAGADQDGSGTGVFCRLYNSDLTPRPLGALDL